MHFKYGGIIENEKEILSLTGVCVAETKEIAVQRLTQSGLRVLELEELTNEEVRIEYLKKLRERLSRDVPERLPIEPEKKKSWIRRLLDKIRGENM